MYERILVPLDGSARAERVLPPVEPLARAFGSVLILLRATRPPEQILAEVASAEALVAAPIIDPTPLIEAEQEEAETYLEKVASRLRDAGLRVQIDRSEGRAAEVIVRRASGLGVDLIAMTTHGRSGLAHVIFGSVAEAVLRKAACPVLLVRVGKEALSSR
jgi:nucleotide-binding universal stress UspA family protein